MYRETDDCCEPKNDCYSSRDPWYTQSQTSRPTYDMVWDSQQSRPVTATGMNAASAWYPEGNDYSRNQRHPVPLDAPDVALRGQRLMAYEERLRREEGQFSQESGRARPTSRSHRPPMERLGPEARVRRPRTPLLVDRLADAGELAPPQQQEAEPELFREPRDAPEIVRRPLDMGALHWLRCPDARQAMHMPMHRHREMPLYAYASPQGNAII